MIGGLFKSASRVALIASAGILAGSLSAQAADLGGNCCADLEERVAELEATAARKGNRKVSLTVSGHVNEALIFWDDGFEQNAYIVSNNQSRTRFRFVGDAKITPDWSAGYLLEIGVRYANSGNRNQDTNRAGGDLGAIDIRHSAWWLDSKQLGRIWVGQSSTATDGITEINLSNAIPAGPDPSAWLGGFWLRRTDGALLNGTGGFLALNWNNITPSFAGSWAAGEGDRNNVVRYVSPTFAGFIFSASWGEDDMWDVALRYAGEFAGFRVAAGVGYKQQNDNPGKSGADGQICADLAGTAVQRSDVDCNALAASGSVMHIGTGLYVAGSWGRIQDNNRDVLFGVNVKDEDEHWYIQGGIEQKFFGLGKTTVYGEYGQYDAGAGLTGVGQPNTFGGGAFTRMVSSDVNFWGLGVVQSVDAAAMDLYIAYRNFSADVTTSATGANVGTVTTGLENWQAVMTGAIIRF